MSAQPSFRIVLIAALALLLAAAARADDGARVKVDTAFIELHTGPGPGYPIFQVVDRGRWVSILQRKTDWFKVRTEDGIEGWVSQAQMEQTVGPDGEPTRFAEPDVEAFTQRQWEMGALWGEFGGANVISVYGGYALMEKLSVELWVEQVLAEASTSMLYQAALVHQTFPEWRISPFFTLGGGIIETQVDTSLVEAEDASDETAFAGLGLRGYLTRNFMVRAEYKKYVVFTSRDDNEEIEKWQLGVAFFF